MHPHGLAGQDPPQYSVERGRGGSGTGAQGDPPGAAPPRGSRVRHGPGALRARGREGGPQHTRREAGFSRGGSPRDAVEGEGPQRRPQRRLGRRLEEVAEAVGGGYCRLETPLKPALGVRGTVAGHRLRALERGVPPPFPLHPWERSEAQAHTDKRSLNGGVRCGGGGGGGRASDWASGWGPQHLHFTVTVLCDGVPPAAACARHWAVSEGVPGAPPSERAMRTFVPFHCGRGAVRGACPEGGGGGGGGQGGSLDLAPRGRRSLVGVLVCHSL